MFSFLFTHSFNSLRKSYSFFKLKLHVLKGYKFCVKSKLVLPTLKRSNLKHKVKAHS